MTFTAIAAVVPRKRTVLTGRVTSVVAYFRPWVRLNVGLTDGTGTVILRFSGRTQVPGIVTGCRLRVEGTPFEERGTLVILNPLYSFLADDGQTG